MTDADSLITTLRDGPASGSTPPGLTGAAERAGLLDVAYATFDGPLGHLVLAATEAGLVRLAYADDGDDAVLAELAARVSPRILAAPRRLDAARRQLDEYLTGRRRAFALTLDRRLLSGFAQRVLAATDAIPYGDTATYKAVATAAGSPRGFRAAGNALGSNPLPVILPCHRVVHAGGGMGGYTGGLARKRTLLAIESGTPAEPLTDV